MNRLRVRFSRGARREFFAAGDEYDGISPTLFSEFGQRVDAALQTILEYPEAGSPHLHGTRRMVLTQFPYSLIYRVVGPEILIVAVPHHRQELGTGKTVGSDSLRPTFVVTGNAKPCLRGATPSRATAVSCCT